uniref:Uncharacterized protein n=1 Tax=Parascaris equorum TaxID=6256 RepID=A0A914R861_PAREQ
YYLSTIIYLRITSERQFHNSTVLADDVSYIIRCEKRRKQKKDGLGDKIPEDEPAAYNKALWVVVTKVFADREKKRKMLEERANEENTEQVIYAFEEEEQIFVENLIFLKLQLRSIGRVGVTSAAVTDADRQLKHTISVCFMV